jgi:hypothetical protein
MRSFILSLPAKLQPVVIIGSTVIAAFTVSLLTRAFFYVRQLEPDIALTSVVYGTLGTLYAVLVAFVVSGVWQSFSNAGSAVNGEANALADLVLVVNSISTERAGKTRDAARAYVESVIDRWDLLELATLNDKPSRKLISTPRFCWSGRFWQSSPRAHVRLSCMRRLLTSRRSGSMPGATGYAAPEATRPAPCGVC